MLLFLMFLSCQYIMALFFDLITIVCLLIMVKENLVKTKVIMNSEPHLNFNSKNLDFFKILNHFRNYLSILK